MLQGANRALSAGVFGASAADMVGRQSFENDEPSALTCQHAGFSTGEVSPDRVDLMLLDEEMRTRSLPSWMRNKNKGKLQDASQHPVNVTANILTYLL